jgi:hypothetical protein
VCWGARAPRARWLGGSPRWWHAFGGAPSGDPSRFGFRCLGGGFLGGGGGGQRRGLVVFERVLSKWIDLGGGFARLRTPSLESEIRSSSSDTSSSSATLLATGATDAVPLAGAPISPPGSAEMTRDEAPAVLGDAWDPPSIGSTFV